jgi:FKBP-type peptidyl-prolyl cis-trans isomerase
MCPGGIRDVLLPPIAHYGRAGYAGVIPEDTTLTMQVELLQISN